MRRALIYIITGSLFAQIASPAFAQRHGGATGPRGGHVEHYGGARRGATTYHGPHGGSAARAYGPRGSVSGARGPYGGGAAHVRSSYSSGGRHYYRRHGTPIRCTRSGADSRAIPAGVPTTP